MKSPQGLARAALLTAGPLILFGPMLARGEALYWGTPMLQFVPWRVLALGTIFSGHLPLWDSSLGMGAPLLANYQSALLYPPNFLLALTGPAWGHALLVALHLVWAAWGMALLAERLGMGDLGQVVGGLSFSLSGYMVARAGFLTINAAAAWLPWLVLGAENVIQACATEDGRPKMVRAVAVLAVAFAFQWLAGHAQTAWYSLCFVTAWVLWRVFERRRELRPARAILGVAGAGLIALALAAAQLVPTLEYLVHSQRGAAVGREFALTYSFWPWRLIGLVAPNLFGNPASSDYWGYGNFWEDAIYVGVLPFVMASAALIVEIRHGRRHASLVRMLAIAVVLSFLLALGKNTPLFPFLFDHVPTFDLFQAPTRWTLILVFGLSLLASIGVDGWSRPTGRGLYWSRLGTVAGGVVLVASPLGLYLLHGVQVTFVRGLAWAGGLLCVTGVLTLLRPVARSTRWLLVAGGFVLLDLCLAGYGLNPSIDVTVFRSHANPSAGGADHRAYMTAEAEYKLKFEEAFPFSSFQSDITMEEVIDLGVPNTLILRDRSSANNFDPLLPDRYSDFIDRLDGLTSEEQTPILQLMDVSSFTSLDGEGRIRQTVVDGSQRVWVVNDVLWVASGREALERVFETGFRPDEVVVLEGSGPSLSDASAGQAHVVQGTNPNKVELRVTTDREAWLVLSDLWYPGWSAFVDDRPVDIYRADYLFRAVDVPKGEHTIRFVYSPPSFWIGLGVSAIAWLMLFGVMWRQRRG